MEKYIKHINDVYIEYEHSHRSLYLQHLLSSYNTHTFVQI
jgi:hypothetical protein